MSEMKYIKIRRLIYIIFVILWIVVLFFEASHNVSGNMIFITGFISLILYYIALNKLDKYYEEKNNNELYSILVRKYKNSSFKYYNIYYHVSKYRISEDLQKQIMVKELQCKYQNNNYNITILSIAIASFVLMIDNIDKIYTGIMYTFALVFSLDYSDKGNEIFVNISIAMFIFVILIRVIRNLDLYRFHRYIFNVINEVEKDIHEFDEHGNSKNSKIIKCIESKCQ